MTDDCNQAVVDANVVTTTALELVAACVTDGFACEVVETRDALTTASTFTCNATIVGACIGIRVARLAKAAGRFLVFG